MESRSRFFGGVARFLAAASLLTSAAALSGCGSRPSSGEEGAVRRQGEALAVPTGPQTFSVTLPQNLTPQQVIFGTSSVLSVDDSVDLRESTGTGKAAIANVGTGLTTVGVLATPGLIESVGNVQLNDRSHVFGSVTTQGVLGRQNQVIVDGTVTQHAALNPRVASSFTVQFPTPQRDVDLEPDQPTVSLNPGGYGDFHVKSRSAVVLTQPGNYYFSSFFLEPGATLSVKNATGPIYVFVGTGSFTFRGTLAKQTPASGNVLFGYLGTADTTIEAPFNATVISPNSKITLISSTISYNGSFFGKSLEAMPNTVYVHNAFNPGTCSLNSNACTIGFGCPDTNNNGKADCGECPAGHDLTDTDGDGVPNCTDACPVDPHKSQPGVCGCGRPDTDSDHDGLLDCQDGCPTDPANTVCTVKRSLPSPLPPANTHADVDPQSGPSVDPKTCTPETGVLAELPPGQTPTAEQLDALVSANTGSQACVAVQDVQQCPPDPNQVDTKVCSLDADCASLGAQFKCLLSRPTICLTNSAQPDHLCDDKTYHCAVQDAACLADPAPSGTCTDPRGCGCAAGSTNCGCSQVDLCGPPGSTGNSGPSDPNAYTPILPAPSQKIKDARQPDPLTVFSDPIQKPGCGLGNCWCRLAVPATPPFTQDAGKDAHHGGGSMLDLEFNPDVNFAVDLKPLPFGDANFTVKAGASFVATATVNFPSSGTPHTFVDIGAGVNADRCNISTSDTRFKIFGIDFVDLFGNTPFDASDATNATLSKAVSDCQSAVSTFQNAADRVKKSLRDAETIINAYKSFNGGAIDRASFCTMVGTSNDKDFPSIPCSAQPVEATINQYIDYYSSRVKAFTDAALASAAQTSGLNDALAAVTGGSSIPFLDIHRSESQQIAAFPFFIGPIPCAIEIDIGLNYGVDGDLTYAFTPGSALALAPNSTAQLIAVSGEIKPAVTATLGAFAGVSFGVPGFSVKAGIRANLNLATITANLNAGVGLAVRSKPDSRPVPGDLAAISNGSLLLPAQQYEFFADWFYGASIGLDNVLSGNIEAYARLKAFFFSKTLHKTLLTFPGIAAFNLHEQLIQGGGELPGITLPVPGLPDDSLGQFQMQLPFVEVPHLPVPASEATTGAPFTLPTDQVLGYDGFCTQKDPR
jgi:hypothetical protein